MPTTDHKLCHVLLPEELRAEGRPRAISQHSKWQNKEVTKPCENIAEGWVAKGSGEKSLEIGLERWIGVGYQRERGRNKGQTFTEQLLGIYDRQTLRIYKWINLWWGETDSNQVIPRTMHLRHCDKWQWRKCKEPWRDATGSPTLDCSYGCADTSQVHSDGLKDRPDS